MMNRFLQIFHKRSFLRRLFFYFFSVSTLILIFLLISYFISSKRFKDQMYDKVDENLIFISDTVDTKIETVQKMALSFFHNESVLKFYRVEEDQSPEIQAEQWRVCKVLTQSVSLFSDFVERYYAFYTLSDKVYTGAGVYTKEFFFNELYKYEAYSEEYWKSSFKNNSFRLLQPSRLISDTYGEIRDVLPVVYAKNIQGKQVVFVADISSNKIKEILDCATILNGINVLIIQDNQLLIQSSEAVYSKEGMEHLISSLSKDSGEKSITIDGSDYYIFYTKAKFSKLSYVALVPIKEVSNMMFSNLYYILTLGIVLICGGLVLSVFFSYRIYKPINTMITTISVEKGVTIVDEFSYLQQSVSNMVEEKQNYNKKLEYYGESYVEHQMQLLVNGFEIIKLDELLEILKERYGFLYEEYLCLNILFHFSEEFYNSFPVEQQDIISGKLRDILQTILDINELCYVFQIQKGLYTCVINYDGKRCMSDIKQSIYELQAVFKEDSSFYRVQIGMDSVSVPIDKLSSAYNFAMVALRNCNTEKTFELIDYQELSYKNKISFTFYDQKKIVNCINIGSKEKLLQLLNQIMDENIKRKIAYQELQELYMQIYYVGQRCLEENQLEYTEIEKTYSMIELIKNIRSEEDIYICKKNLIDFLTEVLELVIGREQREEFGPVYKIKQYIEINYSLNLSLDHIADEFGLTAKYVSKIFKQKTGENITDYIDRMRINHSKILLTTTNMKIADIATAVGIESRTTFFRVFRKLEGISPNEYRTIATSDTEIVDREE